MIELVAQVIVAVLTFFLLVTGGVAVDQWHDAPEGAKKERLHRIANLLVVLGFLGLAYLVIR